MINLNHLRIFYHAAKNLSYTLAAGELFITQPAVTAQIKAFESYCGIKLFKKKGRHVFLTEPGEALFESAKKIFAIEKEIENTITAMERLERGTLRLGTTKAYARYLMPFILSSFHAAYPRIKLHLNEGSSRDMAQSLLDFKNEVAVIAKAVENPEVVFLPFAQEELVVILSPAHHLVSLGEVSFDLLSKEPMIMKETGSGTRRLVNDIFTAHNCKPNVLMETSNTEFIKQLVQRNEGISILVKASVAQELEEKKLATVSIRGRKFYLDVSIAYYKKQPLSPAAKAFIESLKKLGPAEKAGCGIGALVGRFLADQHSGGKTNLIKAIYPPK